jgi:hypothetical protein
MGHHLASFITHCRQHIVTYTQTWARNEAIEQIITESGWK